MKSGNTIRNTLTALLSIIIILSISSCKSKDDSKIEASISKEKMIDVMTEVYLMESFHTRTQSFRPGLRDSLDYYYKALFDRHNISSDEFNRNVKIYASHTEVFKAMHEEILNRLSILKSKHIEKTNSDSLSKVTVE